MAKSWGTQDVERYRDRMLSVFTKKGLDRAMSAIEKDIAKEGGSAAAPVPILATSITVLLEAGETDRALKEIQSFHTERKEAKDRRAILEAARPLIGADLPSAAHVYLWKGWAMLSEPDACFEISRHFESFPRVALDRFRADVAKMLATEQIAHLGHLGSVHLHYAEKAWNQCLPGLRALAKSPGVFAEHALWLTPMVLKAASPDDSPTTDFLWASVEIHMNAGHRKEALAPFRTLIDIDPAGGVAWMEKALAEETIRPGEAERLATAVLDERRSPRCGPVREFLFEKCVDEDRIDAALAHLMVLVRASAPADAAWTHAQRLSRLKDLAPADLPVRCAWAELCCRAGQAPATMAAIADVLTDAPEQVVHLFDLWPDDLPPELVVQRATAQNELDQKDEATRTLSRLLESDPGLLPEPLERFISLTPDHGPFRLLQANCLHRLAREDEALDQIEALLDPPAQELDRVHEFLSGTRFGPEARARSLLLLVRASLALGLREDVLDHLDLLRKEDRERYRAALRSGLEWQGEWTETTERAGRFARHLFEGDMPAEAIAILDGAAAADPDRSPDRARELSTVFDAPTISDRRELGILLCRYRIMVLATRWDDALLASLAIADAGRPEEAYGLLPALAEPEPRAVLPHLLALSIRLGKPAAEILDHASRIFDLGDATLTAECYRALVARDEAEAFGRDGTELLGKLAVELGRHEEAARWFERLLAHDAVTADAGLERVQGDRPELTDVRAVLADSRRERGLLDEALSALESSPRQTDAIRAALTRLTEHRPVHLDSWYVQAAWMEKSGETHRLIDHLDVLRNFEGSDLARIDQALDRMRAAGRPPAAGLWLAAEVARRRDNTGKEIEILFELLAHGEEHKDRVFTTMDDIRRTKPSDAGLIVSDLRLSATGGMLARVVAAGRAALEDGIDPEERSNALAAMTVDHPDFVEDHDFQQTRLDLALAIGDAPAAEDAYRHLHRIDADRPADRWQNSRNVSERFGEDIRRLEHGVAALLELDRPKETPAFIRKIETFPEADPRSTRSLALTLTERAVAKAPRDLELRLTASDLAAKSGDAVAALEHALGANEEANRERILGQLMEHRETFPDDPRFDMALAVEVLEPAGAPVKGAEHLDHALRRDPRLCETVREIAMRFGGGEPNSAAIQSVRARAAVLMAIRDPDTAREAVGDLRRLPELDRARRQEALDGLEKVLAVRPELREGRFLREELLRSLGRTDAAIAEVRDHLLVLCHDPVDEYEARYRLADSLEERHEYAAALAEWRHLEALPGLPDDCRQEVPRRIRLNFLRRTEWEIEGTPVADSIRRAGAALRSGKPGDALNTLPPDGVPDSDMTIPYLAVRGAALLALSRHGQVLRELWPRVKDLPVAPPLDPFQREFLFAVGRSALEVEEYERAFHCLERVARDAPWHRGVRELLDHAYHLRSEGLTPDLEMTLPLEEVANAW